MRYFYSDPLAAAWMAKHFGMRFLRPDGSEPNLSHSSWERKGDDGMINMVAVQNRADSIHPDSLHLLEPMVGDVARYWITKESDYFSQSAAERTKEYIKKLTKATMFYIKHQKGVHKLTILQRNNMPFHWPEVDNDN